MDTYENMNNTTSNKKCIINRSANMTIIAYVGHVHVKQRNK